MPDFGQPFSGISLDQKISKVELVRAIRFFVSAEYEAIQMYMQIAEATDDDLSKRVLVDIANEEKVHAGEFLRLLKELAPDEEGFYKDGAGEVEDKINKGKKKKAK